eukprot:m.7993 g.7993  ORF g.7993 m.7993 type:complete len:194 (-) comp4976_c0_seq2:52-633(-)
MDIIHDETLRPLLAIVKGLRNGVVYGTKIRFPHALVMTFLFRKGSLRAKIETILRATFQHARNLGIFVTLYKTLMLLMEKVQGAPASPHAFLAGLVGGYVVFGEQNPVNTQINLYLLSRITYAAAQILVKRGVLPEPQFPVFPAFGAFVWAWVMWMFEHERETLQPSLQSSMTYLYKDSNVWDSWRNFLWHNK